jgi:fused signal recognition particle receptor
MGQNAIMQARVFHEATPLTGAVVSKLDGSAKAGFIFSIQKELGVPVRMVGLGEGIDDLVAFDPRAFVNGLLAIEGEEAVR